MLLYLLGAREVSPSMVVVSLLDPRADARSRILHLVVSVPTGVDAPYHRAPLAAISAKLAGSAPLVFVDMRSVALQARNIYQGSIADLRPARAIPSWDVLGVLRVATVASYAVPGGREVVVTSGRVDGADRTETRAVVEHGMEARRFVATVFRVHDPDVVFATTDENADLMLEVGIDTASYPATPIRGAWSRRRPGYPSMPSPPRLVVTPSMLEKASGEAAWLRGDVFASARALLVEAVRSAGVFMCIGMMFQLTPTRAADLAFSRLGVPFPAAPDAHVEGDSSDAYDSDEDDDEKHGGVVLKYVTGWHRRVAEIDIVSCYPSIAVSFRNCQGRAAEGDAVGYKHLADAVAGYTNARRTATPFVAALCKRAANSMIGVLYQRSSRWFSPSIHSRIITGGRAALQAIADVAGAGDAATGLVIGGTVDSVFVSVNARATLSGLVSAVRRRLDDDGFSGLAIRTTEFTDVFVQGVNAYVAFEQPRDVPFDPYQHVRFRGAARREAPVVRAVVAQLMQETNEGETYSTARVNEILQAEATRRGEHSRFVFACSSSKFDADACGALSSSTPAQAALRTFATCPDVTLVAQFGRAFFVQLVATQTGVVHAFAPRATDAIDVEFYARRVARFGALMERRVPPPAPRVSKAGAHGQTDEIAAALAEMNAKAQARVQRLPTIAVPRNCEVVCSACATRFVVDLVGSRACTQLGCTGTGQLPERLQRGARATILALMHARVPRFRCTNTACFHTDFSHTQPNACPECTSAVEPSPVTRAAGDMRAF